MNIIPYKFDEYIDMFSTLNHMLHTIPVDNAKYVTYFNSKNPSYSSTRKKIHICNRADEIKEHSSRNSQFAYTIFDTHHVIYPKLALKHTVYNTLMASVPFQIASTHPQFRNYIHAYYKWNNNYYHFITECLPSVLFLNKQIAHYPVLCPPSAFCRDLFQFMGVDNPVMHQAPASIDLLFEQPYVECGNPSPEKIELVREVICQKLTFEPSIGILIFRKESIRSILNHDEVLAMLQSLFADLEWRVFGSESIANTADLFRRAKVIVAPHGAGLTNMLFSAAGTPIIEFMPVDSPNICYWHMAESLGNPYRMIACKTVNSQMIVDIEESRQFIAEAMNL